MNVVGAVQEYINKMLAAVPGMKVLLMDPDTVQIVSMVYTQTALLAKDVYLPAVLDTDRDKLPHLKAVVFVRPTERNWKLIAKELGEPRYSEYHLFFSNVLIKSGLEELANTDVHQVVEEVQEFYGDYWAVDRNLFSLNIPVTSEETFERVTQGLLALLLSLKKSPMIRFAARSPRARALALELKEQIAREKGLFDTFAGAGSPPLLLVMDRRDDPVTPLLTQWTYQAMVHGLLGINNNIVDMKDVPDIREELKEIVLSADQDPFYASVMYHGFGDLGDSLKKHVDAFQEKNKSNVDIKTLDQMKAFLDNYHDYRKHGGSVTKHVAISSELSRLVADRRLMEISEIEQNICGGRVDHADIYKAITDVFADRNARNSDLMRLTLLYALKYETSASNRTEELLDRLRDRGVGALGLRLIPGILKYGGAAQRGSDLFQNKGLMRDAFAKFTRGLSGIQDVFNQHQTNLQVVLDQLLNMRLREAQFEFAIGAERRDRPQDVIVFVIGGATYEEAAYVAKFNASGYGVNVVLGGTTIHNAESFLEEVAQTVGIGRGRGDRDRDRDRDDSDDDRGRRRRRRGSSSSDGIR